MQRIDFSELHGTLFAGKLAGDDFRDIWVLSYEPVTEFIYREDQVFTSRFFQAVFRDHLLDMDGAALGMTDRVLSEFLRAQRNHRDNLGSGWNGYG